MTIISGANRNKITIGDINNDEITVRSLDERNSEPQQPVSKAPSTTPIKMIYRGLTYYYDPAQARPDRQTQPTNRAPYKLIYRGVTYHIDPSASKPPSTAPRSYELIYRGSTYQVTRDEAGAVTAITPSTKSFKRR
jgi:YHS domain-containing protein